MWRDELYDLSTVFGYEDGVGEFSSFVETTTYTDNLDPQEEPAGLFGALHLWLYYGDGLTICPTYESFMVTTILIIEDWLKHDRVSVAGVRLWPFEDNTPVALIGSGSQLMIQSDERLLMRREVYEQLKSTRDARDRDELFGLINRIKEHLAVPDVKDD